MGTRELKISDRLILRLDQEGEPDEIVLLDEKGECLFHLERMTKRWVWIKFYGTELNPLEKEIVVAIESAAKIKIAWEDDSPLRVNIHYKCPNCGFKWTEENERPANSNCSRCHETDIPPLDWDT